MFDQVYYTSGDYSLKASIERWQEMTTFIVRVELHGASESDYERLHVAMAQLGFLRNVIGSDGNTYRLPTAEYRIESANTVETVRDLARGAANTTGRSSWVLAVASAGMAWYLVS
jgi:hypothetical protein